MNRELFSDDRMEPTSESKAPLAERMRPRSLEEVVGQSHLVGEGRFLRQVIQSDEVPSLIFWGPPGVGKTSLARLIANLTRHHFAAVSAVLDGIKEVRKVVDAADFQLRAHGRRTILFVDEIHRFNKAQQDAFLPHVEKGSVVLLGATTENPSFEVISPLLSRCRVVVLEPLTEAEVLQVLKRASEDVERGLGQWRLGFEEGALKRIALFANGDARVALNALEVASLLARRQKPGSPMLTLDLVREALQKRTLLYDRAGEEHFNVISALHKSLRNSDADAALYWLARMLEAGEDPLYVARRLVRFASEDVGLADPAALGRAIEAWQAVHFIGLPEGKLALAQLVIYLAAAPKSNSVYLAYGRVEEAVHNTRSEPVPLQLRNAPTQLMKELGYGRGYQYSHDVKGRVANLDCLPEKLRKSRFYVPTGSGFEKEVGNRLKQIQEEKNLHSKEGQE